MVNKKQATDPDNREFHYGECKVTVGPRGGITSTITRYRRTGAATTWKTRPFDFRVPIKFGMRNSGSWYLTPGNAAEFHLPCECPLLLKCVYCGSKGPDVRERPDGYARDINNQRGAKHISCDSCHQNRLDDI